MAGKMRFGRKATKGKKVRWAKGQSCCSNPKFNKYREEAKKRLLGKNQGEGILTQDALAKHNTLHEQKLSDMQTEEEQDTQSIGAKTFDTFATNWSECSNESFNRLFKNWRSDSPLHKEMLAVLAAVTEVIKMKGGQETETEYFAALMTTLNAVDTDEAITAVICLLSMVIKRLPPAVLKIKFSDTSKVLVDILSKYINSEYNALLRNTLGCLSVLLRAQEPAIWSASSTLQIYSAVLAFTVHSKPKVRKAAQHAVCAVLKGSAIMTQVDPPLHHPAAVITAKFCIQKIKESGGSESATTTFYVMGLLKDIIGLFPPSSLKPCCETVLQIMTLSTALITSSSLKALHGLFTMKPKPQNFPAELNAQIITALYDFQPNINDNQPLIAWLLVMKEAFLNLIRLNVKLCISHLPKFYSVAIKCLRSNKPEVFPAVAEVLVDLLKNCIQPSISEIQQLFTDPSDVQNNPVHKMFHFVEGALTYEFHRAWKNVLLILAVFFDVAGKQFYPVMIKCLQSLADLHDSVNFPYTSEVHKAVGIAVQRMGPQVVLQAIPLLIDGENDKLDFPRSWLLPVLRDNVKETELAFFTTYFLPLAAKIKNKVAKFAQEGRIIESKTYSVIHSQIWSLLPGFCTHPTDLKESFKGIARILGTALNELPDIRITLLSSLRLLVNKNIDNEKNKSELARFSKNYLPILFNLYTTETKDKAEENTRLAVYDTIKVYLQITDKQLCGTLFNKAIEKLKSEDASSFNQHSLLDLGRAMLPYIEEENVKEFYEYCKLLLQHKDHTIQKKAYCAVKELCSCETGCCPSFVKNSIEELKDLLLTSLSSSSLPSKAPRLSCIQHIVHQLTEMNKDFIITVVPEAILCTKENSEKARTAAFDLLIEIGHTLKRWQPDNTKEALRDYMQMLLAGLAGGPHLISATVLALGRVMYEFKDELAPDIVNLLIQNMGLLLTSRSREIVLSVLSFIKALFATLGTMELAQHVEFLVKNLLNLSEDNQRHFRFKAKEILIRLVRKFGYEMISKMIPSNYHKQLTNIRKIEARKARNKSHKEDKEDDDSDVEPFKLKGKQESIEDILQDSDDEFLMDEDSKKKAKIKNKGQRKQSGAVWISERDENDIVDFLDPGVSKRFLGTAPEKIMAKAKTKDSFEIASDGRLIIKDEEGMKKGKRKASSLEDISDELSELTVETKKKKMKVDDIDDEDFLAEYQPGGKGIHRPIDKSKDEKNVKYGNKYKAKKGGGDVKKKGQPDPYAYIPLNRQVLNKRKRVKFSGQFKGIVQAAKRGARKGAKSKSKRGKKK